MKRGRKFSVYLAAISLVLVLFVPTQAAFANTTGTPESTPISRLAGTDRYETSVKISQAGWADNSSQYAVLSAGMDNNLVDALTAAPLAKLKNAPILLTEGDKLNSDTKAELQRLGVTTVYVTSGIGVITQPALDELKAMQITVIPLGGADRFATALNIANVVGVHDKLVVASAYSNADALSIASIAAAQGMPILLSNLDKLPDNVAAYVDSVKSNVQQTYVIGGTGVLSSDVQNSLPHPFRIGGIDRFDTNKLVLGAFSLYFTAAKDSVYVANGDDDHLVDALTGSVLAAKNSTAIVLTSNPMQANTTQLLKAMFPLKTIVALGGDSIVSETDLDPICVFKNYTDPGSTIGGSDPASPLGLGDNIQIAGDNTTLQNTNFSYNLYVTGNNVKLSNLNVDGGIILEPSGGGTITLDNVTAKGIVFNVGATGTFQFNNVKADILETQNTEQVKIVLGGNTVFKNSIIMSNATIDCSGSTGSFGNVLILGVRQTDGTYPSLSVQLAGTYEDPVLVGSQATVTAMPDASVGKIAIATVNKNNKIIVQGKINKLDVLREGQVEFANGSAINNVTIYANTTLTVDQTATVGGITKNNNAVLTLNGDGVQNVKQ